MTLTFQSQLNHVTSIVVWPRGPGGQVTRSFPCFTSLHIARSKELEAASRSSKRYLAKDGGGRSAPIQSWSRVRALFGEHKTEQLGGHSQEQQRHRQAPIDDFYRISQDHSISIYQLKCEHFGIIRFYRASAYPRQKIPW